MLPAAGELLFIRAQRKMIHSEIDFGIKRIAFQESQRRGFSDHVVDKEDIEEFWSDIINDDDTDNALEVLAAAFYRFRVQSNLRTKDTLGTI